MSQDNNQLDSGDDDEADDDRQYTSIASGWNFSSNSGKIVFTEFTDAKIKEETPIREQMEKQLKKILYSKRKSAKMFYNERPDYAETSLRYME